MNKINTPILFLISFTIISSTLLAGNPVDHHEDAEVDPFIGLMLGQVAFMEGRITSLAEAIPEEKYSWKPDEEV